MPIITYGQVVSVASDPVDDLFLKQQDYSRCHPRHFPAEVPEPDFSDSLVTAYATDDLRINEVHLP